MLWMLQTKQIDSPQTDRQKHPSAVLVEEEMKKNFFQNIWFYDHFEKCGWTMNNEHEHLNILLKDTEVLYLRWIGVFYVVVQPK